MKQEWMYAFRMLILLLLHSNDFVSLKNMLQGFTRPDCQPGDPERLFNEATLTKYWIGEHTWDASEKGVVIRCGEGLIGPGIDKGEAFRTCVVPPLKSYYNCGDHG